MLKKMIGMLATVVVSVLVLLFAAPMLIHEPALKPVTALVQNIMDHSKNQANLVVQNHTLVIKKNQYSCGDAELYYRGAAPQDLIGLNGVRLSMLYPKQQGWQITFTPDELVITKHINGLCGMHRQYRHWGLHEGMLAVYQGPLGCNDVLMRVEKNIAVDSLPNPLLEQLRQAAYFNDLDADQQLNLKNALEFKSELEMNEVMENFDEHSSHEF